AIHAGSINRDHVHLLLSIPPSLSVSGAVQYLKGRSSHKLLAEFASLRKRYWGQHLWARGYWVASSGNVTDEVWAEYIENQSAPEPDDDFNVTRARRRRTDPPQFEATAFEAWTIHFGTKRLCRVGLSSLSSGTDRSFS